MLPKVKNNYQGAGLPSIVDEFFGKDFLTDVFGRQTGISTPSVNIIEKKNQFELEIAAPGYEKEDFTLSVQDRTLTISSEKKKEASENDETLMRREFSYASFKRSFVIPDSVNPDNIHAQYQNGLLKISLPKKKEAKLKLGKRIKIK